MRLPSGNGCPEGAFCGDAVAGLNPCPGSYRRCFFFFWGGGGLRSPVLPADSRAAEVRSESRTGTNLMVVH
jgi:hypothetical protein